MCVWLCVQEKYVVKSFLPVSVDETNIVLVGAIGATELDASVRLPFPYSPEDGRTFLRAYDYERDK